MTLVPTPGLRRGDVLADGDVVTAVTYFGGVVWRVEVVRNGRPALWFAGSLAQHEVTR